MTLRAARAKAKKRTAEGVPTRAVRDKRKLGGWATQTVALRLASYTRHRRSEKGRATRARYAGTPKQKAVYARYASTAKGKARNKRYDDTPKGRANQFRENVKRDTGARLAITSDDIARLRERQGHVCPITKKPLDQIRTANDHCHGEEHLGADCLRGVIHFGWNGVLGRTDEELFEYTGNLLAYAAKRKGVLRRRACRAYRPISKRVLRQRLKKYRAERLSATNTNTAPKERATR